MQTYGTAPTKPNPRQYTNPVNQFRGETNNQGSVNRELIKYIEDTACVTQEDKNCQKEVLQKAHSHIQEQSDLINKYDKVMKNQQIQIEKLKEAKTKAIKDKKDAEKKIQDYICKVNLLEGRCDRLKTSKEEKETSELDTRLELKKSKGTTETQERQIRRLMKRIKELQRKIKNKQPL